MFDSLVLAGVVAHLAFWILLIAGATTGTLSKPASAIFLVLWLVGYLGLPRISAWAAGFVSPWAAILDIVLVLAMFKGDIRIR